ncbi:protein of unknown function (DUF4124) [Spongiibacter sp. IMCC21906]|jgi:hypothetical protein|uniref:DUF4124 domain-containing protein n=1 Tax=Spongiibacter sp. IMCC21906 TaxID=1620392 RepID=UPI00062E0219|nr:DUF4124 domain-containing protein [Spongiibacter sp. IMCC21906]AKH68987.1 protein of unknown function (DUF4124) [Spongiibacter sp. IMCC21906]
MKTIILVNALLLLSLGICATAHAGKQGYYRWQDEGGEVHFSQQPPHGQRYEFISTGSNTPYTAPEFANQQNGNSSPTDSDKQPEKMEILPPKDPAICQKAKRNLQSMQANARIRVTNADGSSQLLSPKDIEVQRARAKEAVKIHCDS